MRAAWLALLLATPLAAAPRLVPPADLASPSPVIRIEGLVPGGTVRLSVVRRTDATATFVGEQRFPAPSDGTLLLDAPAELAAFWDAVSRPALPDDPPASLARLRITDAGGTAEALVPVRPATAFETIGDTPFPGALLVRPPGRDRPPVVILLGGSEGGVDVAAGFAPLFVARGYAALALPYVNGFGGSRIPGLPDSFTEVPVDRLDAVRDWLRARPDVDGDRVGLWGASKGAELALLAAARDPGFRAVVAVVPSDVVWEGWGRPGPASSSFAVDGRPLPFVPYDDIAQEFAKYGTGGAPDLRRAHVEGRARNPARVPSARIPVERIAAPVLVVGGGADSIWPSLEMAEAILRSRRAAGLATEFVGDVRAGHALAGPGLEPARPLQAAGGEAAAIARVRLEAWARTFALFDSALQR